MNYIQNITTLSNKIINKNIYVKYIFRYKKDKRVFVIDSDSNFSNINIKKTKKKEGASLLLNCGNFKHKYFKEMQLQTFSPFIQLKNQFEIASTLTKELNLTGKCLLQILTPTKGGFFVKCKSIVGFLPKSQFKLILKSFLKNNLSLNNISSKMYLCNLHNLNVLLTPRVFFKTTKMSIIPYYQKNNFISFFKKRTYNPRISFIFISNKTLNKNSYDKPLFKKNKNSFKNSSIK